MKHTRVYQESPDKLEILTCKVSKMLHKKRNRLLSSFELTGPQFDILSAIYQFSIQKREIIQIDLSNTTEIDPMTTSTILRNLQRKGLITRSRGVINTRTVEIEFTPKGFELYKKASVKIKSMNESLFQNIDKEHLVSILDILLERLV